MNGGRSVPLRVAREGMNGTSSVLTSVALAVVSSFVLAVVSGGTVPITVLLIPVILSAFPLIINGRRLGFFTRAAASASLFAFAVLSVASVGLYYIPSAVAMVVAAIRSRS